MSTLAIRSFRDEDYAAFAGLHNAVYPEFGQTEEAFRFDDKLRPEKCQHRRWIAERDGRVVGYGQYDQYPHVWHPRKFALEIAVSADCLVQGVGSALYRTVVEALRPLDPLKVDMWAREDMSCRVQFLANRGFRENYRLWTSELDLQAFDPARFSQAIARVEQQGVEITTHAALGSSTESMSKLFDLQLAVREDVPIPTGEERQPLVYEEWLENHNHPTRVDEGYFVAVADGRYVGVSSLWQSPEADTIRTGLTAVRREYRRRGIALALKVRALSFAKAAGYRRTVTDNASINQPMLAINHQLGFARHPAWIHYVCTQVYAGAQRPRPQNERLSALR
ncbi:MAG TPA: GNAT family N-acetyltransferase [Chloroflexota bacterium]|nr:GNAT family N-acetyltransferase [Chloroflexota bacterium]